MANISGDYALSNLNAGATGTRFSFGRFSANIGVIKPSVQTMVVEDNTQKIKESSANIFNFARTAAMKGFKLDKYSTANSMKEMKIKELEELAEKNENVLMNKNGIEILIGADEKGQYLKIKDSKDPSGEAKRISLNQDTRISWGSDGELEVYQGSAALDGGVLKASGSDDILVRVSAHNVEAGDKSKVINLGKGGSFSGGSNVTYLGSYVNSQIKAGKGLTDFAGYFENSSLQAKDSPAVFSGVFESADIESGKSADVFSGYFSHTKIDAGDGENIFSGLFLQESKIKSGKDADTYTGRFIDSFIDSGAGDDVFGSTVRFDDGMLIPEYINSIIEAGEGNDNFHSIMDGGKLDLGDGDDQARGVFSNAKVLAGVGNDSIAAVFSLVTEFDGGEGDDHISVATGDLNTVSGGNGVNTMMMGEHIMQGLDTSKYNAYEALTYTEWLTATEDEEGLPARRFGRQKNNTVEAEQGENTIYVRDGNAEHIIKTGTIDDSPKIDPENAIGNRDDISASFTPLNHENEEVLSSTEALSASSAGATSDLGLVVSGNYNKSLQNALFKYVSVQSRAVTTDLNKDEKKKYSVVQDLAVTVRTGVGEDLKYYSDGVGLSVKVEQPKSILERMGISLKI